MFIKTDALEKDAVKGQIFKFQQLKQHRAAQRHAEAPLRMGAAPHRQVVVGCPGFLGRAFISFNHFHKSCLFFLFFRAKSPPLPAEFLRMHHDRFCKCPYGLRRAGEEQRLLFPLLPMLRKLHAAHLRYSVRRI